VGAAKQPAEELAGGVEVGVVSSTLDGESTELGATDEELWSTALEEIDGDGVSDVDEITEEDTPVEDTTIEGDALTEEDMLCDILVLCGTGDESELEAETVELRLDEGVVGAVEAVDKKKLCWIEEEADELAPTLLKTDEIAGEVDAA
jgi:hypothetical protein